MSATTAIGFKTFPQSIRRRRTKSRQKFPWLAVIVLGCLCVAALFAADITGHSPTEQNLVDRLTGPSAQHLLGTDDLGRDVLTRVMYGGRVSLMVALAAIAVGALVGVLLGLVAGYFGSMSDVVVSRVVDATLAIPPLFFGLLFAVTLGPGMASVILAIGLVLWSRFSRIVRAEVRSLRERDYVRLAKVVGCSRFRILWIHVLPNITSMILVLVSVSLGEVVLTEATLSFLGAGISPPQASWGSMISEGRNHLTTAWWASVAPGVAILLTVLAFNQFGDWVRDRLDPRSRTGRADATPAGRDVEEEVAP